VSGLIHERKSLRQYSFFPKKMPAGLGPAGQGRVLISPLEEITSAERKAASRDVGESEIQERRGVNGVADRVRWDCSKAPLVESVFAPKLPRIPDPAGLTMKYALATGLVGVETSG